MKAFRRHGKRHVDVDQAPDPTIEDPTDKIKGQTDGHGPDACIDAVGTAAHDDHRIFRDRQDGCLKTIIKC